MTPDESENTSREDLTEAMLAAVKRYETALLSILRGGRWPDPQRFLADVPAQDRPRLKAALDRCTAKAEARAKQLAAEDRTLASDTLLPYDPGKTRNESGSSSESISVNDPSDDASRSSVLAEKIGESKKAVSPIDVTIDSSVIQETSSGELDLSATIEDVTIVRRGPTSLPFVTGFEIISELGRGGMGVVYKARQIKLNRMVALKMVLAGAHAGSDQLARFFSEAEAVAQLVHPNIVQIYEVGEHDGFPFFSLEYVDGGSLADKLAREPMQARDAAQMLVSLARAMAKAHSQGVIHRDLKPGNVLLTSEGVPKVTDFGLAKRLESDSSQTRSGTLMGTPSYMAPEQAKGESHVVGPLSDVYSLGVILYECLTGRTPFVGTSIMDTLQQVQKLEPVPPKRLQPNVPSDLDTICLKCLQKEPGKRYASADALADDLERFVTGQPILARPISSTERLWRWGKRNPRVAALSAALLALLVTTAIGSTVAAFRISQAHEAAVEARNWAEQKARSEERLRQVADASTEEALKARTLADANAKVANDQASLALTTLQLLVIKVQEQLEDAPRTQQLKKDLLETAMAGLKQVAQHAEKSTSTEATMAAAHMKMGQMFRQLGDTEEAFNQFALCHEITRKRAQEHPEWAASQANLAATTTMLGNMSQEIRRDMKAALDQFVKAVAIYERLNADPRGNGERPVDPSVIKRSLAEAYTRVAVTMLRQGDPLGAAVEFRKALAIRDAIVKDKPDDEKAVQDLTRTYIALAEVHFRSDDRPKALEYYAKCVEERERMTKAKPDNLRYKWELAAACGNQGDFHLHCSEPDLARPLFERELALCRELVLADPENTDYQRELGVALLRSGVLAFFVKDPSAESLFSECLKIREALAKDSANERRKADLMLILPRVGQHERAAALAENLLSGSGNGDPEVLFEVARCYAGCTAAVADDMKLRSEYEQKAIKAVSAAIGAGYRDWVALSTEPDLEPIRKNAEFESLVNGLKTSQAE